MGNKVKLLGHPIHPMLIVFPLGLLSMGVFFDVLYVLTQDVAFATVAFYNIATGIIGGLTAALFGFLDWITIPGGTRAKRLGLLHGLGNVVVVGLFTVSWFMRASVPSREPSLTAFVLGLLGISLALVTGWLGGELVNRLGIGVEPGANPNSPSSLSGKPADMVGPSHPY